MLREVPLFEEPDLESVRDRLPTDEADLAFVLSMHERGGAVIDLGDQARRLCDSAIDETERYFTQGDRVQDAWRRSPAVRKLANLPLVQRRLAAAYARKPFAFQTLNFREGSQQPLHTDTIHFSSLPERFMCGVWIALEDVQPGCGPLVYHPGSHRLPVLSMRDVGVNGTPQAGDYDRYFVPRFADLIAESGLPAKELVIPKGHAFVWAANLAHGGAPIMIPGSTRRSLVAHYFFDDCLYFTPMLSEIENARLDVRLPPDVRAGRWRWRWSRQDGKWIMPSMKTLATTVMREVRNRPHVN